MEDHLGKASCPSPAGARPSHSRRPPVSASPSSEIPNNTGDRRKFSAPARISLATSELDVPAGARPDFQAPARSPPAAARRLHVDMSVCLFYLNDFMFRLLFPLDISALVFVCCGPCIWALVLD